MFGSFDGSAGGRSEGATLELGQVFSTGIAAQNLTQGMGAAALTNRRVQCINALARSTTGLPPAAFAPPPKVWSAVVRLEPRAMDLGGASEAAVMETPRGPVAVCVLTSENRDRRWADDNAGDLLCAALDRPGDPSGRWLEVWEAIRALLAAKGWTVKG